jgi:acyl-coenzyme A thioesterase PaaI-like protein
VRIAVIAAVVDIVGSLNTREIAGNAPAYTADLSVRAPCLHQPEKIVARKKSLRAGQRVITTGVTLDAGNETFAYGETNFTYAPTPGVAGNDREVRGMPEVIDSVPLDRPLHEAVGVEVVDATQGFVQVEMRDELCNPGGGAMQGALVALLCEVSAESLAQHIRDTPQIVTEIDLRYLAATRVGPIASRARWVGPPEASMIRVELRDRGNGDQITATALLRSSSAPVLRGGK